MIQLVVINSNDFSEGVIVQRGIEIMVNVADTPLQAYNSIIHINPDVIIVDITNRDMDTDSVVKRLRNMNAAKEVPILLLIDGGTREASDRYSDSCDLMMKSMNKDPIFNWIIDTLNVPSPTDRKKVMVIDDDNAVCELVELFIGAKYDVVKHHNAFDALMDLMSNVPDLILLDIAMPEIDGKELYARIRAICGCEEVPILFQSGMAGTKTVRECLKLGAVGFVIKPVRKDTLLERVDECINGHRSCVKKNVYIFEEYDFMYKIISGQLEEEFNVVRGTGVIGALNIFEKAEADVIIINLDNSSFSLKKVRDKAQKSGLPVLILTQNPNSPQALRELNFPETYILQIPLNRDKLLEKIRSISSKREEFSVNG